MNQSYIAVAVLVSSLITLALRAFPVILTRVARRHDALFTWLGRVMPFLRFASSIRARSSSRRRSSSSRSPKSVCTQD